MSARDPAVPAAVRRLSLPRTSESTFAIGAGALLLVVAVLTLPGYPQLAAFSSEALTRLPDVLAPLLVVALFLERAIEVIMTAWRAEKTQTLQAALTRATELHAQGDAHANPWAAQANLARYKAQSQRLAFFTGIVLALVLSMMGLRAIEMLVEPGAVSGFTHAGQRALFVWTDVGITALLLAGGADGIHKVVDAFTTFMDSTKQRVKSSPGGAG